MNTLEKCHALVQSLQAQIVLVERMAALQRDLIKSEPSPERDDIVTNLCHTHRLLGAGDQVTHGQIDMLLVPEVVVEEHCSRFLWELKEMGYEFYANSNTFGPFTDGRTYSEGVLFRPQDVTYIGQGYGAKRYGTWYDANYFQKGSGDALIGIGERVERSLPA